ncbi:MAG: ElyC/SanA/YdcF family protein [Ferruginibacter sp.]
MKLLQLLKGLANVEYLILLVLIIAFVLYRYHKKRWSLVFVIFSALVFLLCATPFLPTYFADKLERQFAVYPARSSLADTGQVFIMVLGSGYTLDKRLPATSQLGTIALARLAEGIRIHRQLSNSFIITSGYAGTATQSQAMVTKRAAVLLGVDSNKILMLQTPKNTEEEALELKRLYAGNQPVIIVTDAMHMRRAIYIFAKQGFAVTAAPTNFKITEDPYQNGIAIMPSFGNIALMNYVLHEWLGTLKAKFAPASSK